MSGVRVLVGTRKGAFVLTSDGTRGKWSMDGPHFAGLEIYHVKGSPADPDRIYASQSSSWFGQVVHRSDDGGKSWHTVSNEFADDGVPGPPTSADGDGDATTGTDAVADGVVSDGDAPPHAVLSASAAMANPRCALRSQGDVVITPTPTAGQPETNADVNAPRTVDHGARGPRQGALPARLARRSD